MGLVNCLIEGVSCTGKTSLCHALRARGYQAFNGDTDLAYKGDPKTGRPLTSPPHASEQESVAWVHAHQIWDAAKVRTLVGDTRHPITFLCGGSRNVDQFIHLFDSVFILHIDRTTLDRRLSQRPEDEFGSKPEERDLIIRLHASQEDVPQTGIVIDATQTLQKVVDTILARCPTVES